MYKLALLSFSLLVLGGCTSVYYPPGTTPPVPVEDISTRAPAPQTPPAGQPAPSAGSPVTVNPAIITTPPPRPSAPSQSAPASPLDDDIRAAMQGGDFERAAALTERALRIRPREATLWHTLATIRFNQGRVEEAQGHAQRALSFTTDANQRREIEALLTQIRARG